jgi:hypothetical protein
VKHLALQNIHVGSSLDGSDIFGGMGALAPSLTSLSLSSIWYRRPSYDHLYSEHLCHPILSNKFTALEELQCDLGESTQVRFNLRVFLMIISIQGVFLTAFSDLANGLDEERFPVLERFTLVGRPSTNDWEKVYDFEISCNSLGIRFSRVR